MWREIQSILSQMRMFLARPVKYSWRLAVIQGMSLLIALFFLQYPNFSWLLPGYAVAALGLVAMVMTIRAEEEWSRTERIMWLILATILMVVEMRVIKKDRDQSDAAQNSVAKRNQDQFDATMSKLQTHTTKLDELSQSEEHIQTLTKKNLENITGGDSFAYIAPQNFSSDRFEGIVWNNGEQALVGLTLTIAHVSDPIEVWSAAFSQPIFIGTVAPHDHAPIPNFYFQPRTDTKSGQDNYWIMLAAQNGTAQQSIYFRRSKMNSTLWAYSFQVVRAHYSEKPQKEKMQMEIDDTPRKGPRQELLLFRNWTDDMEERLKQRKAAEEKQH